MDKFSYENPSKLDVVGWKNPNDHAEPINSNAKKNRVSLLHQLTIKNTCCPS